MHSPAVPTVIAVLLGALACGCTPAGDTPAGDAPAGTDESQPVAVPPGATAYDCDAGTTIAIDAEDGARATLPDGQAVTLSRVAGSTPAVYSGASLYLRIEGDNAWLSQGDGGNELACTRR